MKKLFFIFLLGLGFASAWAYLQFSYPSQETVTVEFEPGTSLRKISNVLAEKKVISNARFFEVYARFNNKSKEIKAGEYEFKQELKIDEVLTMLAEGRVVLHPFTVPEGYNIRQIGDLIQQKGMGTQLEWMSLMSDKEFIKKLGLQTDSLEGYLFPDTYNLQKNTTLADLAEKMVRNFKQKVTPDLLSKAQVMGFSLHQWITLASIIEKETGVAAERPLIASVFLNRTKIDMPLQTDPTVIYGITNFNGNLTRNDLETDTPYNTYTRKGLPPGPICSPGLESMLAVLNPTPSEFLYFVGKGDGTHQFSKTLEEHNAAVDLYQRHNEPPPDPKQ
jgi:UPF0755 protein